MEFQRPDDGSTSVATLDIETTHYDPERGEVVAVGVGVHERGSPGADATYDCFYRESAADEAGTILAALDRLADYRADRLVTYKGGTFDLPFLRARLAANGADEPWFPFEERDHTDLFVDRKREAEERGEKWPSLEECLESYGVTPAVTEWAGRPVTNTRFGGELGPAYLRSRSSGSEGDAAHLRSVVDHYLRTDLEANLVVYYGDLGVPFEPVHDGTHGSF